MARLVAVSGGSGFVGWHLVRRLLEGGSRVRLLTRHVDRHPPGSAGPVELVPGRLADAAALARLCEGADAVVNAAGLIKARRASDFETVNVEGVEAMVAAARAAGVGRFVHLSSLAAREPQLSAYADTKRRGEEIVLDPGSGLAHAIAVRAPAVYGPRDRETLAFFRMAARGLVLRPGGAPGRVALIHVSDLVELLARAVEADAPPPGGEAYEADDGAVQGYSIEEMGALAARAAGVTRVRSYAVPAGLLRTVAVAAQLAAALGGPPVILSPGKVRELLHPDWTVRERRLAHALGYEPRFEAARGFIKTINWYRRRGWLPGGFV